jgi:hypothetical protein
MRGLYGVEALDGKAHGEPALSPACFLSKENSPIGTLSAVIPKGFSFDQVLPMEIEHAPE